MEPIPSGTVTFAFTDIESSTQSWERDRAEMQRAVRRHDAVLREAIARHGGYVFKTVGDAFCAAFSLPANAVAAMLEAQRGLAAEDFSALDGLRVRAAIHTGTADEREGDYFGPAVNRVARLLAIGHGGQILVSGVTAALVHGDLPPQSSLADLGDHRLKDLAQPERVYELKAPDRTGDFPPLRSLNALVTNLPLQLTSFVGRENEIAEISALVPKHRLITLVGSGGVGKTRAALYVAAGLVDGANDGVWFVQLAPLTSGAYIPSAIAQALDVALPPDRDPLQGLVALLKPKRVLLILDNCEHLVGAVADVVSAILNGCPNVRVLATSRQAIDIAGEQTYHLPSLAVPKQDDIEGLGADEAIRSAAIALFVERAAAVDSHFALTDDNAATIADICVRLDGIPLEIELAASRTTVLGLKALSERLNERFRVLTGGSRSLLPRQQTLRALIDWSYDLLDDDERATFRRLSVFAGGWALPAAAAVCADVGNDEWRVLDLLSALVAKSLVVVEADGDDRRYRLLNSIREYSRERLAASNELDDVAAKHARYYAGLVGELAALVDTLEDERWQNALAPEVDNIRAALDWAIVRGNETETGLSLLARVEWPERVVTPHEAIAWFDAAAHLVEAPSGSPTHTRIWRHRVRLEWFVGRPVAQREKTAKGALAAAQASADFNEIAHALTNLGSCYRDAGRFDDAEPLFAQAYALAPNALSPMTINTVVRNWAVANLQQGDLDTARRRFTEVADRERPGSEAHASALLNLGELEFAAGNLEAARTAARSARATFVRLNAAPLGLAVCNLAAYAMALNDLDDARALLRETVGLLKRSATRWTVTALEHHAVLAGLAGDHERAATLLGFTDARFVGEDTRQRTERHGYERLTRLLSAIYDRSEIERLMRLGARLTDEQALEHAVAISQPIPHDSAMTPNRE